MKIYTDDPNVPYRTTKIGPLYTRSEIDGVLAKWGIKQSGWNWDLENLDIKVTFQIRETIEGRETAPIVTVQCPLVFNRANRNRKESINWAVSMRSLYWYIKTHLEMAHLLQSSKATEFLPHIQVAMPSGEVKALKDLIIPDLEHLDRMAKALPNLEAKR